MSPVSLLLNVIWIVLGGAWMAFGWLVAAVVMAITIIGIPWARAAFNIAVYTLQPFATKRYFATSIWAVVTLSTSESSKGADRHLARGSRTFGAECLPNHEKQRSRWVPMQRFLAATFDDLAAAVPANDWQDFAGDVARAARSGHEYKRWRYFFRLGRALHGGVRTELLHLLSRPVGGIKRRPHRPWCNRVHTNALVHQARGQRAREGVYAALSHRVVEQL